MRLSPLDIRKQEFDTSLRGYDREDVAAFQQMVSEQWEDVLEEQRRLEEQVRELKSKMEHYQQVEEALQEALQTARENAESKVENAEREATLLIQEAEARAEEIKRAARKERDQFQQEANKVGERRDEIVARLRAFLGAELELLARFSGRDLAELVGARSQQQQQEEGSFRQSEPGWLEGISHTLDHDPLDEASRDENPLPQDAPREDLGAPPAEATDTSEAPSASNGVPASEAMPPDAPDEHTSAETDSSKPLPSEQAPPGWDSASQDSASEDQPFAGKETADAENDFGLEQVFGDAADDEHAPSDAQNAPPPGDETETDASASEDSAAAPFEEERGAERRGEDYASPSEGRGTDEWDIDGLLNPTDSGTAKEAASGSEPEKPDANAEEERPADEEDETASSEEIDKIRRILSDLE